MAEAPDYPSYSERELRQILTRIDVDRFPDRVVAIHRQLEKLEVLKARMAPPGATGPRISVARSPRSRRRRMIAYFALCAAAGLASMTFANNWKDVIPVAFVILGAGLAQRAWDMRFSREVYDFGTGLLIREGNYEFYVGLEHIHRIDAQTHDGGHDEVVIELKFETKGGEGISFFPTPDAMNHAGLASYVAHLRHRVRAAQ